jgi:hypothetical protein
MLSAGNSGGLKIAKRRELKYAPVRLQKLDKISVQSLVRCLTRCARPVDLQLNISNGSLAENVQDRRTVQLRHGKLPNWGIRSANRRTFYLMISFIHRQQPAEVRRNQ